MKSSENAEAQRTHSMPTSSDSQQKASAVQLQLSPSQLRVRALLEAHVAKHGPMTSESVVRLVGPPLRNWRVVEAERQAENEQMQREILAMPTPKLSKEQVRALLATVQAQDAEALLDSQSNSKAMPESSSSESSPSEAPAADPVVHLIYQGVPVQMSGPGAPTLEEFSTRLASISKQRRETFLQQRSANEQMQREILAMPKLTMEQLKALRAEVLRRDAAELLDSQSNSKATPEED